MTSITIRCYKQEDHKDVNRIFAKGMTDIQQIKSGVLIGYHSHYVISYLAFVFFIGYLYSTSIIALMIGLAFHGMMVILTYHVKVW